MKFARSGGEELERRLNEQARFIQVITGPRQVGKTTLVRQVLDRSGLSGHYASADAEAGTSSTWVEQQWTLARQRFWMEDTKHGVVVLDEIQKIPNWSEQIKAIWDDSRMKDENFHLVLLGSSTLHIQLGLTESLAGRFEQIALTQWSLKEMQAAFGYTAEEYVWYGGYPGAASLRKEESRWKSYVKNALAMPAINRDILMMVSIRKPTLLQTVFELGTQYAGQILSYNKMLGQLQDAGNTTTLAEYLRLLGIAGLMSGLPNFYRDQARQRGSSPKFQPQDTAFISAWSSFSFDSIRLQPELWGRQVEAAVGAHLLHGAVLGDYKVFYWRHKGHEVDFVLKRDKQIIGIEVKSGLTGGTKGMEAFRKRYKPDKLLLIGPGAWEWQDFISYDPIRLFD